MMLSKALLGLNHLEALAIDLSSVDGVTDSGFLMLAKVLGDHEENRDRHEWKYL